MTREMQKQEVVRTSLREHVFYPRLYFVRGFVANDFHLEVPDPGIVQHSSKNLGIRRR
jgi:hypothetical protein